MPPITDDDDIDLDSIIPTDDGTEPEEIDAESQTDVEDDEQPGDNETDPDGDAERGGEQDDEPADEQQPLAAGERGGEQQPRRGGSRENRRIRTLSAELAEQRRLNAENQRRLDELAQRVSGAQQQQHQQPRETADQRNQRRALMTPEERMNEDLQGALEMMGTRLNQTTFTVQDQADKSAFEAKSAVNPLFKKWASKVETELASLRSKGTNVAREAVLHYLVGRAAVESYNSKTNRQRQGEGTRRVNRQTTKPGDTRSDTQAPRRGQQRSLEDRLAGVQL